jgi:hypothetical protein
LTADTQPGQVKGNAVDGIGAVVGDQDRFADHHRHDGLRQRERRRLVIPAAVA